MVLVISSQRIVLILFESKSPFSDGRVFFFLPRMLVGDKNLPENEDTQSVVFSSQWNLFE